MKYFYSLFVLILLCTAPMIAQFTDDMESYTDGQPISGGHWTDWGCGGGAGCAIMSTSEQARSGLLSGNIPGDTTTDAVLDLGNKIFGTWSISFFMYIPSNKEAYIKTLECVPICASDWQANHILFNENNTNPGVGTIYNTALGDINFTFPHDQWFSIIMYWDISAGIQNATWEAGIDSNLIVPAGTPYTDDTGTYPLGLGGIEFFSISPNNHYYVDDFCFSDSPCLILNTNETNQSEFTAAPNPVHHILKLSANNTISAIRIFTITGQQLFSTENNTTATSIDMSHYASGIYFVKVSVGTSEEIVKIIKQ